MSTTTQAPRTKRTTLILVLVIVVLCICAVWLTRKTDSLERLHPQNSGPDGAKALAQVLDRHGVRSQTVRGSAEFDRLEIGSDTTVVVLEPDNLGEATANQLQTATEAATLVLLDSQLAQEHFDLGTASWVAEVKLRGECAESRFSDLRLAETQAIQYATTGCFAVDGDPILAISEQVYAFGAGAALSNDQITHGDNAAIGVRLLGQHPRLVWYLPEPDDDLPSQGLGSNQIPPFFKPTVLLLALALIAVVWWRARRFGPLSREPLPVTVKASEVVTSRARLYHRHRNQDHAAQVIRTGTQHRLRHLLGLPPNTPVQTFVTAVARSSGRTEDEVASLIGVDPGLVSNDKQLLAYARQLFDLEEEVRQQ